MDRQARGIALLDKMPSVIPEGVESTSSLQRMNTDPDQQQSPVRFEPLKFGRIFDEAAAYSPSPKIGGEGFKSALQKSPSNY